LTRRAQHARNRNDKLGKNQCQHQLGLHRHMPVSVLATRCSWTVVAAIGY
jgi:hypothetical protein